MKKSSNLNNQLSPSTVEQERTPSVAMSPRSSRQIQFVHNSNVDTSRTVSQIIHQAKQSAKQAINLKKEMYNRKLNNELEYADEIEEQISESLEGEVSMAKDINEFI